MKSNKNGLLARNVMHLGIMQVTTTALGIVLAAALGRSLGAADFGILYTVLTICGFVGFASDWGESTYVVRAIARRRSDESVLIGSALLIGTVGSAVAVVLTMAIAWVSGHEPRIVALVALAVVAGLPLVLYQRFGFLFRGRDRMDLDAIANIVAKALTLAATLVALYLGGGVRDVILAQGVGGLGALFVGAAMAMRLGIRVEAPTFAVLRELLFAGPPIVALSLVSGFQPFIEVMLLSTFTSSVEVGWYGASRTIFGIITSPGLILAGASFPELSRAALSLPAFRQLLDSTARVLLVVSAFVSSALFLFADKIVTIVYGHGHFEQSAAILRVGAIFLPILFLGFLLGTAMMAVGKNKEFAAIGWIGLIMSAAINWFTIGPWQSYVGNGAVALAATAGLIEIYIVFAVVFALPRGAIGWPTLLNTLRTYVSFVCAVLPLIALQSLELWVLAPLFVIVFVIAAVATGLILPNDLRVVLALVRDRRFDLHGTNG